MPLRESVIETVEQVTTDPDQPLHQRAYRSPLRDERLAAWLGAPLGILFAICFVTGLFSHIQQHPLKWLPVPARPAGLYRVTQGVHVISGIAAVPFLFAKLWVVWPRFVSLPPFRRVSDVVERLGILALVGGEMFMVLSGVADIAQWYPWRFSFTASHYWVAWITIGAILAHLGAKWHIVRRSLRHGADITSADPELGTTAEEPHAGLTRRGFLATVVGASGALVVVTAGQTVPALRRLALLAPRNPASQPINKSAANAGVLQTAGSADYRLTVGGRVSRPLSFTLDELMVLPSHQAELPIACVEGWSYSARWRGVRLAHVMAMAGAPPDAAAQVVSLERNSPYTVSFVNHFQAHDHDTLLATHLDGIPLSLDHGYPLRLIGPDRPGVNQTKWVTRIVVV